MTGIMNDKPQLPRAIWVGLGLMLALLALAFLASVAKVGQLHMHPKLPVLGNVADFSLTNQDGRVTTLADLSNQVWVADLIFTRCPGPCPRMTAQMKSMQDKLAESPGVKLVTLTTDPEYDSAAVLRKYGTFYGADFNRWTFLTGPKTNIAQLAVSSLKLNLLPTDQGDRKDVADLFIHSTIFVLVDRHAHLRNIFETGGENVDWTNVVQPRLLHDIHELENEP